LNYNFILFYYKMLYKIQLKKYDLMIRYILFINIFHFILTSPPCPSPTGNEHCFERQQLKKYDLMIRYILFINIFHFILKCSLIKSTTSIFYLRQECSKALKFWKVFFNVAPAWRRRLTHSKLPHIAAHMRGSFPSTWGKCISAPDSIKSFTILG